MEKETLSQLAAKIYDFLQREYVRNGYMYSGCLHLEYLYRVFGKGDVCSVDQAVEELLSANLVRVRNCHSLAYELTPVQRELLIKKHELARRWETGKGAVFYPTSEYGEITHVLREAEKSKANV